MSDDALQGYLHRDEAQGTWMMLVNPFTRLAGGAALAVGLIVVAATVAVAVFRRVHFDGVMDLHVSRSVPAWLFAFEAIADWLIVAVLFVAGGLIGSRGQQRVIDYFGMSAIGRLPFFFAGILWMPGLLGGLMGPMAKALTGAPETMLQRLMQTPGIVWIIIGAFATMGIMLWGGVLNYFALREASGMDTGRAIGVFVVVAIVAEVISKMVIMGALRYGGVL